MSYTTYSLQPGQAIQLEMVDSEGRAVMQRPISIEELMRESGDPSGMDIGHGYSIQLDQLAKEAEEEIYREYAEQEDKNEEEEEEEEQEEEEEEEEEVTGGDDEELSMYPQPPPGTEGLTDWYDVLHTLQRENRRGEADSAGGAATRRFNAATPLQAFPTRSSRPAGGGGGGNNAAVSRREVWSALSPPADPKRNYKHVEYVSVIRHVTTRQFRPPPLSLHAATAYLNPRDKCQRVLVYGGVGAGGKNIEQEMYEFSLLSCGWKRVEGKNFVPAGHYGHTLTTIAPLHRVVVVGGIGPGGLKSDMECLLGDPLHAARAGALLHFACLEQERVLRAPSLLRCKSHIGFVPYVFDMDLERLEWRAIQILQPLTLAFHTAVAYGKVLYLFGGLTETGAVSDQLLAMEMDTFAIRVVGEPRLTIQDQERSTKLADTTRAHTPPLSSPPPVSVPKPPLVVPLPTPPTAVSADQSAVAAPTTETTAVASTATPLDRPEGRFLHTAVRYGQYMIIHGGFNAQNEPLGDTWAFDMIHERWERLQTNGNGPARAGHTATVVGSRMLVTGGFSTTLEECLQSKPESEVAELSLIPTPAEEYRWRTVRSRPSLPGLAFSTASPCGDHLSQLIVGGILPKPKPKKKPHRADGSTFLSTEASSMASTTAVSRSVSAMPHGEESGMNDAGPRYEDGRNALTRQWVTLDDAVVMSFPLKLAKKDSSSSGGEVDLSVPEPFRPFVRRQEDFLKKKHFNVDDAIRKITMGEKESMEPTLYLKTEEIELLIGKGEEMCAAFTAYDMKQLPSNVPDRERRVHLLENTISLGRQTRDILKSMKGSEAGITAVKSKTHRQRGGQKFEDYSAAKPFRRFVVTTYIQEIQDQLQQMKVLNKGLREVSWEEKDEFIESVAEMQHSVDRLLRTINQIMKQYVHSNVEKLMKGVEKHKDVMRKLTEIVQKNEHDKIWGVQQARDQQRANGQGGGSNGSDGAPKRFAVKKAPPAIAAVPPPVPRSRSRSALGGAAYYSEESEETAVLNEAEWLKVMEYIDKSERSAERLSAYCREGMQLPQAVETIPTTQAAAAGDTTRESAEPSESCPPSPSPVPTPANVLAALLPVQGAEGPSLLSNTTTTTDTITTDTTANPQASVVTAITSAVGSPPLPPPPPAPAVAGMDGGLAALLFDAPAPAAAPASGETAEMPWLAEPGNAAVLPTPPPLPPALMAPPTPPGPPPPPSSTDSSTVVAVVPPPAVDAGATGGLIALLTGTAAASPSPPPPPPESTPETAAAPDPVAPTTTTTTTTTTLGGGATTREVVVRHSNRLREETERAADMVRHELHVFSKHLRGSPITSLSSSTTSTGGGAAAGAGDRDKALDTTDSTTPTPTAMSSVAPVPPPVAPPVGGTVAVAAPNAKVELLDTTTTATTTTTTDGYHTLPMAQLHALVKARDRFAKTAKKAALIRKNEWDGNDLAGAPQDEAVEKLCRRLEKHLTGLTQAITASFLASKGAKRRVLRPSSAAAPPTRRNQSMPRPSSAAEHYPTIIDADEVLQRRRTKRMVPHASAPTSSAAGTTRRTRMRPAAAVPQRSGSSDSYSSDFDTTAVSPPENSPREVESGSTVNVPTASALPRLTASRAATMAGPLNRLPAEVKAPAAEMGETGAEPGDPSEPTVPLVPFQPLHTLTSGGGGLGPLPSSPSSSTAAVSTAVLQLSSAHPQGSVVVVDGHRSPQVTPLYQPAVHSVATQPTTVGWTGRMGGGVTFAPVFPMPMPMPSAGAVGMGLPSQGDIESRPTIALSQASGVVVEGPPAFRPSPIASFPESSSYAPSAAASPPTAVRVPHVSLGPGGYDATTGVYYYAAPITSCSAGQFTTGVQGLPEGGGPPTHLEHQPHAAAGAPVDFFATGLTHSSSTAPGFSGTSTPHPLSPPSHGSGLPGKPPNHNAAPLPSASMIDEDYFYFGQTAAPAAAAGSALAPASGPGQHKSQTPQMTRTTTRYTRLAPQHVSAPVGTAHCFTPGSSARDRSLSSSRPTGTAAAAAKRSRGASAHGGATRSGPLGSSGSSLPSPATSSSLTAARLSDTARAALSHGAGFGARDGVMKSRMTPGERRILEARERLRRK